MSANCICFSVFNISILLEHIMSYYVEHGAHYIIVSEYRIARYCYHPAKCLSCTVTSFKYAREHTSISVCVFRCVCIIF